MKCSLGWLKKYLPNATRLDIEKLRKRGFPVEGHESRCKGVYTGKVIGVHKHPNAEKLKCCEVDVGNAVYSIVCGAKNVREGLYTAVALDGAMLPCGTVIKSAKVRGEQSDGMMCSPKELGMKNDFDGIIELEECEVGVLISEKLFPEDEIYTIEVTYNRPDMNSALGIAREINPNIKFDNSLRDIISNSKFAEVTCPEVQGYAFWKVDLSCGSLDSKNVGAAFTDDIMQDVGQPVHVFDAAKIQGTLEVRYSTQGEEIELLSGEIFKLPARTIITADSKGPLSIMGVMGGKRAACDELTKEGVFEVVYIAPEDFVKRQPSVIGSASYKMFVRGVDTDGVRNSIVSFDRKPSEMQLQLPDITRTIEVMPERVHEILGQTLDIDRCLKEVYFKRVVGNVYEIPSWRSDISIQEDIAEEVARVHGLNEIESKNINIGCNVREKTTKEILRAKLLEYGFSESMSSAISTADKHGIVLPEYNKWLRRSLVPGLFKVYQFQKNRDIHQWAGIFEIGPCFELKNDVNADFVTSGKTMDVSQYQMLGILLNPHTPQFVRSYSISDVVAILEELLSVRFAVEEGESEILHPNSLRIVAGEINGYVGAVHPEDTKSEIVYVAEVYVPLGYKIPQIARKDRANSQCFRDITFIYNENVLNLRRALQGKEDTEVDFVGSYKNAHSFRVWMSIDNPTKQKIEKIVEFYVKCGDNVGAKLQS